MRAPLRCLLSLLLATGAASGLAPGHALAQAPLQPQSQPQLQPQLQPQFQPPGQPAPPGPCRAAMAVVEREFNLPPALLAAIGRVESGRRDDTTGRIEPYPWTINAEGRGSIYPSKAAAIAAVRDLQAGGLRSIDVGCMQINLRHHPEAFPNLETAFDPLANIRYAARFLTELYASRQDWARAAAAYHSQTPEYAEAYLARVQAAWEIERRQAPPTATALAAASAPGLPVTARPGGGFLSNGAERAQIRTAAPGNVGRGLDAYRSAPIPLAGRGARPLVAENVPAPGGVRRLF